jgi:hypothetical protein
MPRKKTPERVILDLAKSNRFFTRSLKDEELQEYLNALGSEQEKIVEILESKNATEYFVELKNGTKLPLICPKCHEGTISLVTFECVNEQNASDVLFLNLLRCNNLPAQCDFVSSEKVSKFTNKFLEKALMKADKISEAAEIRREHYEALEEEVRQNSFWNITKALLLGKPLQFGTILTTLILVLTFSASVALDNDGTHEFKAGGNELSVEYKYAAPELPTSKILIPETLTAQKCEEYIQQNYSKACLGLTKEEELFLKKMF